MEKLIYLLSRPEAEPADSWNARLLGPVRGRLVSLGTERLKINVIDQAVAAAGAPDPALPAAMVSFCLNATHVRRPYEEALAEVSGDVAGYAVTESTVLPYRTATEDGARSDGYSQIAFLKPKPCLSQQDYLDIWLGLHTQIGVETQDTFYYNQNIVNRVLTAGAPAWSGIVEECYPIAALTDPLVYWKADGSEERRAAHYEREMDSCARFLDLPEVRVITTSEYRFGGWRDLGRGWNERDVA